jgi:cell division protein FtsQ
MNITATVLFVGLRPAAGWRRVGWWAVRHPLFALGGITVQGDVTHNSAATLRANVAPRLRGNFFTVDLAAARSLRGRALGAAGGGAARVPEPAARGAAGAPPGGAVGRRGRLAPGQQLRRSLRGQRGRRRTGRPAAAGRARTAWRRRCWRCTAPEAAAGTAGPGGRGTGADGRGGWQLHLDSGAHVELGRGTWTRCWPRQRFVQTLTQVASKLRPAARGAGDGGPAARRTDTRCA